jgi:hypothetical protein
MGLQKFDKLSHLLLAPRSRLFYVAASETMKEGGLLPKIFLKQELFW